MHRSTPTSNGPTLKGRQAKAEVTFAEHGRHAARFAVGRYEATQRGDVASTATSAETLFAPVVLHGGDTIGHAFDLDHLGGLVPSWVRPESGGWTLRLHETAGSNGTMSIRVHTPADLKSLDCCDLRGEVLQTVEADDGVFNVPFGPYDILSLRAG